MNAYSDSRLGEFALYWLDALADPHLIMTDHFVVLWMNLRAREELSSGDFLVLHDGVLSTATRAAASNLEPLLTSCRQGAASLILSSGDRHLALRARAIHFSKETHIGLKFHRADGSFVCRYADLDRVYGLTRSESLVVQHMTDGMSVDLVADKMGVSVETARSHIRSIYRKTGATCREAMFHRVRPFQI